MKNIKDQKHLEGKIVLLRLDLNVPLNNKIILDETRIIKIIPVIDYLLKNKSKILILSHVGRPNGKINNDLSLQPICKNLENRINKKIILIRTDIKKLSKQNLFLNKDQEIIFLENIRFYKQEEQNDEVFSKDLAKLADLYVNDAFSCSHRKHASLCKITEYLPSYAGLQLQSEIDALKKITLDIKKPISCIIGGSKISTKIGLIKNLISKFDNLIFVGGMANNVLNFMGHRVGKSLIEKNCNDIISDIFKTADENSCTIYYPKDVCVGHNLNDISHVKSLSEITNDEMILDIGPDTIKNILKIISDSRTVFWNGPAGYFENNNFIQGSLEIAAYIAEQTKDKSLYSVAGGGDTIAVINKSNNLKNFSFVSTAGGAFLEYLEGKILPGIKALE